MQTDIASGIRSAAEALGIDPVDLATVISYETGGTFNPTQSGQTTRWGTHRGFIQFGEPQAAKYGVDWKDPINSQLGPNGAIVKYLKSAGVKPGMSLLDIYSAVNAGAPGKYHLSDTSSGGAPGTVLDKVNTQMSGHRDKAIALLGPEDQAQGTAMSGYMEGPTAVADRQAKLSDTKPAENSATPDMLEPEPAFPAPAQASPSKSPQDIYGEYLKALSAISNRPRQPYSLNLQTYDTVIYE